MITKKGTVVKKSGDKTVKVEVHTYRAHPIYKKRFRVTKRFLAHDESNQYNVGDAVVIKQSRPVSKRKSWAVDSLVSQSA
jgi:small subunit ribosomal protein S17